ncbi:MAG: hypothetical protein JJT89_16575 [Nitriliruptoraceae bacterium]|nr:hypothetical protein [Nitriliruptoraceae bacterium]
MTEPSSTDLDATAAAVHPAGTDADGPSGAATARPSLDEEATDRLLAHIEEQEAAALDEQAFARAIAPLLGAIPREDGTVAFGFWAPRLVRLHVAEPDIHLEVLDAIDDLDPTLARSEVRFARTLVPMRRHGALVVGVVRGARIGSRDHVGSFYALTFPQPDGTSRRIFDPMAASLPFGAFAPAEVYDLGAAQAARADLDYWSDLAATAGDDRVGAGIVKQPPATNILQLHVPTATAGGTLASLTRWFQTIAQHRRDGLEPTPHERAFLGYDAVQLLPVEPTTVYETGPSFWVDLPGEGTDEEPASATVLPASAPPTHLDAVPLAGPDDTEIRVELRRPSTTNWGYDVVIAGSAAVNPTLLETGRPDELIDLAGVLHTFPGGPIRLIADVVYGHSDSQGLDVLDAEWFAGPNMYGQNLDYRNPFVRAMLLEMQRRKIDLGFDGVRVDGAQDFKFYDASARELKHDDELLREMSDVVQHIGDCRFRPWMIFEDGRPWPDPDWELASTYRGVIDEQLDDDVFQWGPLTFAHNTPFVYGFWLRSWWRIREILTHGSTWISGCANHDTLRRGTQVSLELNINDRLGDTNLQILDKAYDNPAIKLLSYTAFPGVPMDFINASMRAAWGFIRNTDDRYGVKVLSEEAISLDWQVDDEFYSLATNFRRLKDLGFETLDELRRFLGLLPALVEVTDYDLDTIAALINDVEPPLAGPLPLDADGLKQLSRAWMDDMHDYTNVTRWTSRLSPELTSFNLAVREFRRARPWLRADLGDHDAFEYRSPVAGSTVFAGLRTAPSGDEQVLFVANMQGAPADLVPTELDLPGLTADGWYLDLRTPDIGSDYLGGPITLNDSAGVVFTRRP